MKKFSEGKREGISSVSEEAVLTPMEELFPSDGAFFGDELSVPEVLAATIDIAESGDPEANRLLLEQVIRGLLERNLPPELGCWFANRLLSVVRGGKAFDLAFHLRRPVGRQAGFKGCSDDSIALAVAILQVAKPKITRTAIYEALAVEFDCSLENVKRVVTRCKKNRIIPSATCLEDLRSYEGFHEWVRRFNLVI